jgi:hypothetical protein
VVGLRDVSWKCSWSGLVGHTGMLARALAIFSTSSMDCKKDHCIFRCPKTASRPDLEACVAHAEFRAWHRQSRQEFICSQLTRFASSNSYFHTRSLQTLTIPQPTQNLRAKFSNESFQHNFTVPGQPLSEMSDFEDDMDVDGPAPSHSIQFSSDNTTAKGKRIVADLPVEAEDNLPWYVVNKWLGSDLC